MKRIVSMGRRELRARNSNLPQQRCFSFRDVNDLVGFYSQKDRVLNPTERTQLSFHLPLLTNPKDLCCGYRWALSASPGFSAHQPFLLLSLEAPGVPRRQGASGRAAAVCPPRSWARGDSSRSIFHHVPVKAVPLKPKPSGIIPLLPLMGSERSACSIILSCSLG